MRYYEYTNHKEIYKKTYWGNCSCGPPDHGIAENRNELIKIHNIGSYRTRCSLPKKLYQHIYVMVDQDGNKKEMDKRMIRSFSHGVNDRMGRDHAEYYSIKGSKGKQILSVFSMNASDEHHATILDHGYTEHKPIYALGQRTYTKLIDY